MAAFYSGLIDARGRPIEKKTLTREVSAATFGGVRTPLTSYPGDGLNPVRLAQILRDADAGNPVRFMELAETIEERDSHLVGVLGTRRRSVAQLEITVEPGSAAPEHEKQAEGVREWLKRDELSEELFDMLDAIPKGYSFTEIMWDTSEGQWMPERLEWRDPRWFEFERHNLTVPLQMDEYGRFEPLAGGKFIFAVMKAKSGIPLRGALIRNLAWAWMFKAFSNRDWAIFLQNNGQAIRVGKFGQGATEADRQSLLDALIAVGSDMAAMIPASMQIEFIRDSGAGTSGALYKERVEFLDQQVSKAVLGQTATTDAIAGGHAIGREHRQVQADIERADAKQLSAAINRDLIKPWIQLNHGPQTAYPRIRIGRREEKDTAAIASFVQTIGLPVKLDEMYDLVGLTKPEKGDDVLVPRGAAADPAASGKPAPGKPATEDDEAEDEPPAEDDPEAAQGELTDPGAIEAAEAEARQRQLAADALTLASPAQDVLLDLLGAIVTDPEVRDIEDLRTRILAIAPNLDPKPLARVLRQAIVVAELTGRADLVDG